MAQSIAGTHLATTWAAPARVVAPLVEVCWDGASWTDETSRVLDLHIEAALYNPATGLPGLGGGRPATMTLTLDNADDRYSPDNASSPLHAHIADGIYRVPIRVSLGYAYSGTPERLRQFTGYIESPLAAMQAGAKTVQLACTDNALPLMQHKHSTALYQDQRADQLIAALLAAGGIGGAVLDAGMSVIPWAWLDDENLWSELQQLAQADGGVLYFDELGTCRYERATHWLEGTDHTTAQATLDCGNAWQMEDTLSWRDCYTGVIVERAPRYLAPLTDLYTALDVIEVPPGGSITEVCRLRYPAYSVVAPAAGTDYQAVNAGMAGMTSYLTITMTPYCQRAELTFANSHTVQAMYVLNFRLRGVPLLGDEAQEIEEHSALGIVPGSKIYPLRGNPYVQTEEQARRLAGALRDRLERPRRLLGWAGPACPWLQLGDRVRVVNAGAGIDAEGYILGKSQSYQAGDMWEMRLVILPAANLFPHAPYFRLGVSEWADPSDAAYY